MSLQLPVHVAKYRSRKTGGYSSAKESKRALTLRLMQKEGEISKLREQVEFVLIPKQAGERACKYVADFVYLDRAGRLTVEDVKGYKLGGAYALYVMKRKLMLHVHGIRIVET